VIVSEHRFESFNTWGNDPYIDRFAERLDRLIVEGWKVLGSTRDPLSAGWWRVELLKEARPEDVPSRL
jgi:hypothetical protein